MTRALGGASVDETTVHVVIRALTKKATLSALCAILAAVLAFAVNGAIGRAQEIPKPRGYVNDFASVFTPDTAAGLEDALRLAEQETTAEIVIVTVPNLGGDTIEGYAVELFEQWGIGKKGRDNGVLLLLAVAERKVKIEVGYGLEPYITDGLAGRILDQSVLPDLRGDNFSLGIIKGAQAIRVALDDTGYTGGAPPGDQNPLPDLGWKLWALLGVAAISVYLMAYMARSRSITLGGIWGVAAGGTLGWLFGGWVLIISGLITGGIGGLFLDYVLSTAHNYRSATGRPAQWHNTWGGFGGFGGGFAGGFGGFGGGRTGGGGAGRGF